MQTIDLTDENITDLYSIAAHWALDGDILDAFELGLDLDHIVNGIDAIKSMPALYKAMTELGLVAA